MDKLEKKWWFALILAFLGTILTRYVMDMAGIGSPSGAAQWILYFFCFLGFWRALSLLGWLCTVLIAPRSRLLD